jgi:hypothetical protein
MGSGKSSHLAEKSCLSHPDYPLPQDDHGNATEAPPFQYFAVQPSILSLQRHFCVLSFNTLLPLEV